MATAAPVAEAVSGVAAAPPATMGAVGLAGLVGADIGVSGIATFMERTPRRCKRPVP
jgi:hypothetical protein